MMKQHSDDLWRRSGPHAWAPANWDLGAISPRVDVSEDEKEPCVTADLPGVDRNGIQLDFVESTLTIQGEEAERKGARTQVLRYGAYGSSRRSIPSPVPVGEQKVSASFSAGLLTVVLPKLTPSTPEAKQIPIEPT